MFIVFSPIVWLWLYTTGIYFIPVFTKRIPIQLVIFSLIVGICTLILLQRGGEVWDELLFVFLLIVLAPPAMIVYTKLIVRLFFKKNTPVAMHVISIIAGVIILYFTMSLYENNTLDILKFALPVFGLIVFRFAYKHIVKDGMQPTPTQQSDKKKLTGFSKVGYAVLVFIAVWLYLYFSKITNS